MGKTIRRRNRSLSKIIFYGLASFGLNIYDLLGLCNLVPMHTIHLIKPTVTTLRQQQPKRTRCSGRTTSEDD